MDNTINNDKTAPMKVTVSQVNRRIANLIKGDKSLSDITITGEISNFVAHYKTGHFYFTLKDENSSIKAVMFKNNAKLLGFTPENGMKVNIRGDIRGYEQGGQYQLYAFEIERAGLGDLYKTFLELKSKLEGEGLFLKKREIPRSPRIIAVITAETGAALQDILNILSRRNPLVKVILIPALVQGVSAPKSLISAFEIAQKTNADTIIFGRGGGSIEDLWAFNDELLARKIFQSRIPTISAVGHEVDFTIADFVADLRAPTPSAAAELSVIDIGEVYDSLTLLKGDMRHKVSQIVSYNERRLESLAREINALSPLSMLNSYHNRFGDMERRLKISINTVISLKKQQLISEMRRIDALSPLNVLMRGYSIVTTRSGKAVTNSKDLSVGETVDIKLSKGRATAEIIEVFEQP